MPVTLRMKRWIFLFCLILAGIAQAGDKGRPDYIFGGRRTCNEDYPQCRALNAQQDAVDRMREMNDRARQQRESQERMDRQYRRYNDPNQPNQLPPVGQPNGSWQR